MQAADFTIGYPTGWVVEELDVTPTGTKYRNTTIKRDVTDPHYVVRVDVLTGTNASTIASENIARLSKDPTYRQITRRTFSFVTGGGTYSAVFLEFTMNHSDTGVPIQTADVFFNDNRGRTFAVLTRSPVSEYSQLEQLLSRVRASIIPR
ncbi:MAG: hypothetical protein LC808_36675 [Actinobacteria bacterium]|nr:hypothetical protein [Actinomycetota bacterium]